MTIFVDATHVLRSGPRVRTGIARVETAILRAAIRAGDIVLYHGKRGGDFVALNEAGMRYAQRICNFDLASEAQRPFGERVRITYELLRDGVSLRALGADRAIAGFLCGRLDRRGPLYRASKLAVGAISLALAAFSRSPKGENPLLREDAVCLVSFETLASMRDQLASGSVRAKLATLVHDVIPIEYPQFARESVSKAIVRELSVVAREYRAILAVSQFSADSFRRWALEQGLPDPAGKTHVTRLASFLEAANPVSTPVPAFAGKRFALYCSTIEPRKNHLLLFRIWERLTALMGEKTPPLVIVGRWGWMCGEIEAYWNSKTKHLGTVHLLNSATDNELHWLYRHAHLGLFPSFTEGWGLGATECLDAGLPVLVSTAPALSEATQGLMPALAPDDDDAWLAAVTRAFTNDEWMEELRGNIRQRYSQRTEEDFTGEVLAALRAVVQRPA